VAKNGNLPPVKQLKVMFVGDCGVGKTTIVDGFVNDFEKLNRLEATNAVDIYFKKLKLKDNLIVNVNLC
jgi:GTPase SAR1 family protein